MQLSDPGREGRDALAARVAGRLDRRLSKDDPAPVALALSGGGDSLALLLTAAAWARAHGRPLLALTVDHRLQAESAGWSRFASEAARAASDAKRLQPALSACRR